MKKRLLRTYYFIFICILIAAVLLCVFAGYSVGVLDQNQVIQQVDENMEAAKVRLDRSQEEAETMETDLRSEYASKTRVVAMLLSEHNDLTENETILEELRVVIDAEQISISNETGIFVASTDFSSTGKRVQDVFLPHVTDAVFTDVLFTLQEDMPVVIAASSLGAGKGLVQVQYSAQSIIALSQEKDISAIVPDMPFYKEGISAIVEEETWEYVSHVQPEQCGKKCGYDAELFSKKKGKFDLIQQKQRYLVRYQMHEEYVLFSVIPYRDMDHARGAVIQWVAATGGILLLIAALAMRAGYLHLQQKEPAVFREDEK